MGKLWKISEAKSCRVSFVINGKPFYNTSHSMPRLLPASTRGHRSFPGAEFYHAALICYDHPDSRVIGGILPSLFRPTCGALLTAWEPLQGAPSTEAPAADLCLSNASLSLSFISRHPPGGFRPVGAVLARRKEAARSVVDSAVAPVPLPPSC